MLRANREQTVVKGCYNVTLSKLAFIEPNGLFGASLRYRWQRLWRTCIYRAYLLTASVHPNAFKLQAAGRDSSRAFTRENYGLRNVARLFASAIFRFIASGSSTMTIEYLQPSSKTTRGKCTAYLISISEERSGPQNCFVSVRCRERVTIFRVIRFLLKACWS